MKLKNIGGALKRALPTILTVIGAGGMVGTVILTAKATKEITEAEITWRENPKGFLKAYKWAIGAGIGTLASIFGANVLNRKQQASIASAAILFTEPYRKYQEKVKEKFGEDAHNEIMEEIVMERAKDDVCVYSTGFLGGCSIGIDGIDEPVQQFYDVFSKRYFIAKPTVVLQAMYHANRNFTIGGVEMLQEFYKFLGLSRLPEYEDLLWSINDDLYWIDFDIERRTDKEGNDILVNGLPVFDIFMEWDPMKEEDWEDEYPRASYH